MNAEQSSAARGCLLLVPLLAVAMLLTGCTGLPFVANKMDIVRVPGDAETISQAMDRVASGGLVLVSPGSYPEEVTVDVPDVTLRGTDRNSVVIDGGGVRNFGVVVTASGVRVQNLTVHSSVFYGVLVTGAFDENGPIANTGHGYTGLDTEKFPPLERFAVQNVTAYNNALYGIYAFNARHGSITDSYVSGSADSGIYVGQCVGCNVLVTGNVAERNAIGFENANASDSVLIAGNRFSGNRIGMTLISNYQEAFTPQRANVVVGNLVSGNSNAQSPEHALGGFGIGVGINGGKDNLLVDNRIENNPVAVLTLNNTEDISATGNQIRGGTLIGNGVDYVDLSAARAPATDNCVTDTEVGTVSPEGLLTTCSTGNGGAGSGKTASVQVPPGVSFLTVPVPIDQPGLAGDLEAVLDPLPAKLTLPEMTDFPLPGLDFLADRSGAR